MEKYTFVRVPELPKCDICGEPAHYDAASLDGRWGYFCQQHFNSHTRGKLGLGVGQKLILDADKHDNH